MTLGESLRKSYRDLQQGWDRLADSAFGRESTAPDETARGEFISPFISEGGLTFPRLADKARRASR